MSLVGAIASLKTGTYTRTRTATGSTVDGVYVEGGTSTASIVASIQPVTGRELMNLPEGRRTQAVKVVYTVSDLIASPIADHITINGEEWEVWKVEDWEAFNGGGTHFRAYISKLPIQ